MPGLGTRFTIGGREPDFVKARGATVVYENRTKKRERKNTVIVHT